MPYRPRVDSFMMRRPPIPMNFVNFTRALYHSSQRPVNQFRLKQYNLTSELCGGNLGAKNAPKGNSLGRGSFCAFSFALRFSLIIQGLRKNFYCFFTAPIFIQAAARFFAKCAIARRCFHNRRSEANRPCVPPWPDSPDRRWGLPRPAHNPRPRYFRHRG